MIRLTEKEQRYTERPSSKGNQLKWKSGSFWYKADYTGYEGLAEYLVSALLGYSTVPEDRYIRYETEEIEYRGRLFRGCRSRDFLPEGRQLITLERLYRNSTGRSFTEDTFHIIDPEERLRFLALGTERLTGLGDFGEYLGMLMTIDALFLNEDRHLHNIAVEMDRTGAYYLCPAFDHGAALLADTTVDYPMTEESDSLYEMIASVRAKTFSTDFAEQLEVCERIFGTRIRFFWNEKTVEELLDAENCYPENVKERVKRILLEQRQRYAYLFA
ncbi:MAG: hypothetical protein K6E83_06625 [Clostridium sp.]|nr:hypothetical protein [Clostridium sp.]